MVVETETGRELSEEEFKKEVARKIENVTDYEGDPNPDLPLPPVEAYEGEETPEPEDIIERKPPNIKRHQDHDPYGIKSGKPDMRYQGSPDTFEEREEARRKAG